MAILPIKEVTKYDVEGAPGSPFNSLEKARRAACTPDLLAVIQDVTGGSNFAPEAFAKLLLQDIDRAKALNAAISAAIAYIETP